MRPIALFFCLACAVPALADMPTIAKPVPVTTPEAQRHLFTAANLGHKLLVGRHLGPEQYDHFISDGELWTYYGSGAGKHPFSIRSSFHNYVMARQAAAEFTHLVGEATPDGSLDWSKQVHVGQQCRVAYWEDPTLGKTLLVQARWGVNVFDLKVTGISFTDPKMVRRLVDPWIRRA